MYEIKGKYTTAKVFTEVEDIDVTTQTIAICDHPIFQDCKIRIMPDCHKGKGCTIGFTAEMPKSHQIIPNIIGVDQFCGMLVIKLGDNDITNNYEKLDKVIRRNIPFERDGRQKFSDLVPEEFVEKTKKISKDILKDNFITHINKIGSLGGGNHFISIEKGSTGTYLIIHSGSRNIGLKLAIHYQNLAIERNCYGDGELKQLSFLTDKDAMDYLACAEYCQEYAKLNRKIMAHDIMVGMRWKSKETFETVHNYIGKDNIIRKGAISCCKDEKVLIPLNMAEGSLICIGKGNSDWNCSAPHGAGRALSRIQAKEKLTMKDYKQQMKNIFSSCVSISTLDESPMAYKNSAEIINALNPTAEIIDHLRPLYNFKAKE